MDKRHNLYRFLINLLYPNICPSCGCIIGYNDDFCEDCYDDIARYCGEFKVSCADYFCAFCEYTDNIRTIINHFKFDACGNTYYAFAKGIETALSENNLISSVDVIAYVPMTKDDRDERGYNQCELIAKELSHLISKPYTDALVKIRATKPQKSLTARERAENLKGAFSVSRSSDITGKNVLVIDDLCTTGSTLSECSKTLKNNGAVSVIAASFAKTVGFLDDMTLSKENSMKIFYDLNGALYANITNKCPCACTFCIRKNDDTVGENDSLWLEHEPTLDEIKEAFDEVDISAYDEVVFCGYGEPMQRADELIEVAKYIKEKTGLKIRINTNGLVKLINPDFDLEALKETVNSISISLNASDAQKYLDITRSRFGIESYDSMLSFAAEASRFVPNVAFTVVDVIGEDEIELCRKVAESVGVPLRVRKFISNNRDYN